MNNNYTERPSFIPVWVFPSIFALSTSLLCASIFITVRGAYSTKLKINKLTLTPIKCMVINFSLTAILAIITPHFLIHKQFSTGDTKYLIRMCFVVILIITQIVAMMT